MRARKKALIIKASKLFPMSTRPKLVRCRAILVRNMNWIELQIDLARTCVARMVSPGRSTLSSCPADKSLLTRMDLMS
jgi:hypothetical protein